MMKTNYAKIQSSNYQSIWQVFTACTKKSVFISTAKTYSSKEEAEKYCHESNLKIIA